MAPNTMKAQHYLQLLDDARCEGKWDAILELVRKVRKHAPDRACLALTAEVEHGIATATRNRRPSTARPSTANSATAVPKDLSVSSQLPQLLTAVENEQIWAEDRFQAEVCIGWLHWVVGEYNLAFTRLPHGLDRTQLDHPENISEWTRVCELKAAYLRANCMARNEKEVEALAVFQAAIPSLSTVWNNQQARKELKYWSELFLTEYCMLFTNCREKGAVSLEDMNALASFRSWARYWDGSKGTPLVGGYGFRGSVPRRRIWCEYYSALSTIVQQDLPYPTAFVQLTNSEYSVRSQLRMELKKVEAAYEALLLSETEFPKANEEREEIERFVEVLMKNWAIIGGRGWREQDLGQGGRDALSRAVLDMLYRASMKTFHSTAILRNLFLVHLAVSEFELALKAFDSYLEIVKKGKARVEKTGHPEPSLDDDATCLETICSCISALCRYGDRHAAEKARDLSTELEHWLEKIVPPQQNGGMRSVREESGGISAAGEEIPPRILALAWQSIGLAQAQWARVTFDSSSRTEIQKKAVRSLRTSLSADFGGSADVRSVFALGLLLAEQRELTTAIELVKTALLTKQAGGERLVLHNGPFWKERSLIPLWHLLSLLLSARQEYALAARTCECAFEQFRDPVVLFGRQNLYQSEHLKELEARSEKGHDANNGLVDEMDDFEKESILEVKMTQLAIVEIVEGPKVAVNATLELLSLFSRLFGSMQAKPSLAPPEPIIPPKTSGTFRNFTGSIFRSKSSRASRRDSLKRDSVVKDEKLETIASRPRTQTMQTTASTAAPTIQVTHENGAPIHTHRRRKSASISHRSESGHRNSLRKRDSAGSRRRAVSTGPVPHTPTVIDGEPFFTPMGDGTSGSDFFTFASKRNPLDRPSSAVHPPAMNRTTSQSDNDFYARSRAPDMAGIAMEGMEPTSAMLPVIQFSTENEKRRRSAILIKVWLMIAGLYRRADMFQDAKGAISEAQKLVQAMEAEIGRDVSGSLSLRDPGWAGKKSVEELWGDVWSEMGHLSLAREEPNLARTDFESALTHFPDHPSAIVGLSNILLDIYSEKMPPPPAFPALSLAGGLDTMPGTDQSTADIVAPERVEPAISSALPCIPLGLGDFKSEKQEQKKIANPPRSPSSIHDSQLPLPYKATSISLVDRLASRDRAYGLLSTLTKLGEAWNYSEAWFALARAHEESGQAEKAKEVLWWCVELEESMGVRDWKCVGTGGYVL